MAPHPTGRTPSEKRKAQKRQFKKICSKVEAHVQEFQTPVIVMGLINGTLSFSGSEQLKQTFCKNKDVQKTFLDALVSNQAGLLSGNAKEDNTLDESDAHGDPIDFQESTYRFLRSFISQAVQLECSSEKPLYVEENRPSWWPDLPFISPNHPPKDVPSLTFDDMSRIADSYQKSLIDRNQLGDTSNVGSGSGRIHSDEDDCSQSKTSKVSGLKSRTEKEVLFLLEESTDLETFIGLCKEISDNCNEPCTQLPNSMSLVELPKTVQCADSFSAVSMCLYGTPNVSSKLKLVAALYGASHFPKYVEKLIQLEPHIQCHVLNVLGSTSVLCKDVSTFVYNELISLVKMDSSPGIFHLSLLAGATDTTIIQNDERLGCKATNVVLLSETFRDNVTIKWKSRKLAIPVYCRADEGLGELCGDECSLEELIKACADTCRMATLGQCGSSLLPGKSRVDWVQCSDCESWMHCICTGLTKEQLSGRQFSCCKSVNPEAVENFRVTDSPEDELQLNYYDIQSLYPGKELTNMIICLFIRELLPCSTSVVVVSPLLYQGICSSVKLQNREDRFKAYYRSCCGGEMIWHKGMIAFPCRLELNRHWILVVVNLGDLSAWILDSFPNPLEYNVIAQNLSSFLTTVTQKTISLAPKPFEVPRQDGGVDCGIHVLHNLHVVVKFADQSVFGNIPSSEWQIDCCTIRMKLLAKCFELAPTSRKAKQDLRRSKRVRNDQSSPSLQVEKGIQETSDVGLKVLQFPGKGRGVVAAKPFPNNSFVCEYTGEYLSMVEAKQREREYEMNEGTGVGCYMFYVTHRSRSKVCIDATKDDGRMGRLLNHSKLQANVAPKSTEIDGKVRVYFAASRDINIGEELLYDYGERSRRVIKTHPWLSH